MENRSLETVSLRNLCATTLQPAERKSSAFTDPSAAGRACTRARASARGAIRAATLRLRFQFGRRRNIRSLVRRDGLRETSSPFCMRDFVTILTASSLDLTWRSTSQPHEGALMAGSTTRLVGLLTRECRPPHGDKTLSPLPTSRLSANALDEFQQRRPDLSGRVFLQMMNAFDYDFRLVSPSPGKFTSLAGKDCPRLAQD